MEEQSLTIKEEAGQKPASSSLELTLSTALVGFCNYYFEDQAVRSLVGTAGAAGGYFLAKFLRWCHKEFVLLRLGRVIRGEIKEFEKERDALGTTKGRKKELRGLISQRQEILSKKKHDNLRP